MVERRSSLATNFGVKTVDAFRDNTNDLQKCVAKCMENSESQHKHKTIKHLKKRRLW